MSYINVLLSFIGLSFLIFFHELGHFLFCRYFGVHVKVFSVGFGGSIFSYKDRYGTEWVLGWITLGGFIEPEEKISKSILHPEGIHPFKDILIAFAGPLFNFLLSFTIVTGLVLVKGYPKMNYEISNVVKKSTAARNGFKNKDTIICIMKENGDQLPKNTTVVNNDIIMFSRGDEIFYKKIKLKKNEKFKGILYRYSYEKIGFFSAIKKCVFEILFIIISIFYGLLLIFYSIFLKFLGLLGGVASADVKYMQFSGTFGIIEAINSSLLNGWADFLVILSKISISLGAFNLIPIPVLDGGRILIKFIEWIIGRPINEKFSYYVFLLSFVLMSFLFGLTTFLDLYKWFYVL